MDSKKHSELTSDKAQISTHEGGEFSVFDGYATGKIIKLIPGKLIEQTWRACYWPQGSYSNIRFEFSDTPNGAQIVFTQDNLPEGTQAEFESGWQDNYWKPLLDLFQV